MIKRLAQRTIALAILTMLALWLMEPLTSATGAPEVLSCLKAAAIVAWADLTILWVRCMIAPALDEQRLAMRVEAANDPRALSTLYLTQKIVWMARFMAFVGLAWGA